MSARARGRVELKLLRSTELSSGHSVSVGVPSTEKIFASWSTYEVKYFYFGLLMKTRTDFVMWRVKLKVLRGTELSSGRSVSVVVPSPEKIFASWSTCEEKIIMFVY